jgi:DNA primase
MTASREFEELAERARAVDLLSVIEGYGGLGLKGGRRDLAGPCPQCGGNDRFAVNLNKQVFHCRGCDASGGGAIDFVMFIEGCNVKGAIEILTGSAVATVKPSTETVRRRAEPDTDNSALAQKLWNRRQPVSERCPVWTYLRERRGYHGPLPVTLGWLPSNGEHPDAMIAALAFAANPSRASLSRRTS